MMLLSLCVANVANDCQAIARLNDQHRRNTQKQAGEQKQDRYRKGHSESNTREYLARVIAAAIVDLAIDVQAQTIVLPALGNIRETIEARIRAEAQRKFPNYKHLQDQYAKEFRASFHRWNYGMLARCIRKRAGRVGVAVEEVTTPTSQGTLADKAKAIALAVADKHEFTAVRPG